MGIMDFFTGGTSQQSTLSGAQREVMGALGKYLTPEIGKGAAQYQGQTLAPTNNMMTSALGGFPGVTGDTNALFRNAMGSVLGGAEDPAAVEALYRSRLDPARLEFNRTLQDVEGRYGDTWGRSGALPEMAGRATAEYGMGLNSMLGEMVFQDRNQAKDRQLQGMAPSVAMQQQRIGNLESLYDAGTTQRGLAQEPLTEGYNKFLGEQWYNNPALQLLGPMLGTQAVQNVQKPGGFGALTGAISGAAGAAGGLASLFS